MTGKDAIGDFIKEIMEGKTGGPNETGSTTTHQLGENGQWLIKRRTSKRSAAGSWMIDKDGQNGAQAMECGLFFIRRKRMTIYRDANCDRKLQKGKDKLIGPIKGSFARASSLSGNRGSMEITSRAFKTKKEGKTNSGADYTLTFFEQDNLSGRKISTPIKRSYLKDTNYISEGGFTVNQIETMQESKIV